MSLRNPRTLLALLAALVAAGCDSEQTSGDEREREPTQKEALRGAPMGRPRVRSPLGVVSRLDGSSRILARLNPLTLKPLAPRLQLGEYHDTWSFSPDRSQLALGMGGVRTICGTGAGICIVDLDSMQVRKGVRTPIAVEAVAWLSPRRVVAVLQSGDLVVADPVTGNTLRRQPLSVGTYRPASAHTPGGLVVVLEPAGDPVRVVVVDRQGRLRAARLRRIRGSGHHAGRAGLAVDPRRKRALVFAPEAPVAEVDLRTMRVRYHRVAMRPPASAPPGRSRTSFRDALWLGRGLVAVFGKDLVTRRRGGPPAGFPAGVQLIDTDTWTARTVERRASHARVAAGKLIVYASALAALRPPGVGLRLYTRDGRRLLGHLFGNEALDVQIAGDRAYAYSSRALRIVRVRSGKVIRESGPPRPRDVQILSRPLGSGGP